MHTIRILLVLASLALSAVAVIGSRPTRAAQDTPPAPAWQAVIALADEAALTSRYDPALGWLEDRGPLRGPLTDPAGAAALHTLTQAWAARGDRRLDKGDTDAGLRDLSAVLQHGAAVERHAHTLDARTLGASIQGMALELLSVTDLDALTGAQRAQLLMVLGESAVIPRRDETLARQCSHDAHQLRAKHSTLPRLAAWTTDLDGVLAELDAACRTEQWPQEAHALLTAQLGERDRVVRELDQQVRANDDHRADLRTRLESRS